MASPTPLPFAMHPYAHAPRHLSGTHTYTQSKPAAKAAAYTTERMADGFEPSEVHAYIYTPMHPYTYTVIYPYAHALMHAVNHRLDAALWWTYWQGKQGCMGVDAWVYGCIWAWVWVHVCMGCELGRMGAWVCQCMGVWVCGFIWVSGCVDVWLYGCMAVWLSPPHHFVRAHQLHFDLSLSRVVLPPQGTFRPMHPCTHAHIPIHPCTRRRSNLFGACEH